MERTFSTRMTWKVLDFSGCHIATFRCATSASRRRNVRTVNGSCWGRPPDGVGGCGEDGGVDSGGVATSRPATNITGASCVKSSGGYEFIIPSLQVSGTERALATGYARNVEHNISPTLAGRENMALYLDISFPRGNGPYPNLGPCKSSCHSVCDVIPPRSNSAI